MILKELKRETDRAVVLVSTHPTRALKPHRERWWWAFRMSPLPLL